MTTGWPGSGPREPQNRCARRVSLSLVHPLAYLRQSTMKNQKFGRQGFLGADSQERLERCVVGIVGLGGGVSRVVQQLAHVGFQRYVIYDPDVVDYSNLNRLVGAIEADAAAQRPK